MSKLEIPLLRESAAFSTRLIDASRSFRDSKYQFHRRVNWSHRYEEGFYRFESECFQKDPDAYLSGKQGEAPKLENVFQRKLQRKQLITVVLKVISHWLFRFIGTILSVKIHPGSFSTYRKGYVDDIELVFDPEEVGVIRAIYPFPISIRRQWRYLRTLRETHRVFKLTGNPYLLCDLIEVLRRRSVRSVQKLESRAQLRHAFEIVALGVQVVQLSDEFDIGSLDFCRALARFPIHVVNSAHGVGKYFPVHAYQEFQVITNRQAQYYYATRACRYSQRMLNDRTSASVAPSVNAGSATVQFVFLSQLFTGIGEIIANNETKLVRHLATEFVNSSRVRLLYRPHPNNPQPEVPEGFERLCCLEDVNGKAETIFASFFSTCQIDPSFKGEKVLLRGYLIYPEMAFDESEAILDLEELVSFIKVRAAALSSATNKPSNVNG